jgi:hypothetical protein
MGENQRAFWPPRVSAMAVRMNFDACARNAPRLSRSAVTVTVSAGWGSAAALADQTSMTLSIDGNLRMARRYGAVISRQAAG